MVASRCARRVFQQAAPSLKWSSARFAVGSLHASHATPTFGTLRDSSHRRKLHGPPASNFHERLHDATVVLHSGELRGAQMSLPILQALVTEDPEHVDATARLITALEWSGNCAGAQHLAEDAANRGLFPHPLRRPGDWTADGRNVSSQPFPCADEYPEVGSAIEVLRGSLASYGDEIRSEADSPLLRLGRRDDAHGEGLTDPARKPGAAPCCRAVAVKVQHEQILFCADAWKHFMLSDWAPEDGEALFPRLSRPSRATRMSLRARQLNRACDAMLS